MTDAATNVGDTRKVADRDTAMSYPSCLSYWSCTPAEHAVGGQRARQRAAPRPVGVSAYASVPIRTYPYLSVPAHITACPAIAPVRNVCYI